MCCGADGASGRTEGGDEADLSFGIALGHHVFAWAHCGTYDRHF